MGWAGLDMLVVHTEVIHTGMVVTVRVQGTTLDMDMAEVEVEAACMMGDIPGPREGMDILVQDLRMSIMGTLGRRSISVSPVRVIVTLTVNVKRELMMSLGSAGDGVSLGCLC